jgi:NitT/TauT family transport system substrate-binding protein
MTTRRSFIRSALALPTLGTVASMGAGPTLGQAPGGVRKLTVGVGGFTFAYLPLFVTEAAGFFREEKLDVSLVQTGSGTTAMAAMLGGSFDITGLVLSDVLLAASKGQKITAFAPVMPQYASDAIISKAAAERVGMKPDMPLPERLKRLKGLTLAVSGRGSGIDKMWRYLLSQVGLDADKDVTLTVIKLDQMYPALRAGQIDGYNTTAPSNNRAVKEGLAVWVARPSQGEVPGLQGFVYTILAVNPTYLKANREIIASFVRGLARGLALIHADPARAAKAVHGTIWAQTDLDLLLATVQDQRAAFAPRMSLSKAAFEQNRDFMMRFGEEVKSVEYQNVIDASLIDAVSL